MIKKKAVLALVIAAVLTGCSGGSSENLKKDETKVTQPVVKQEAQKVESVKKFVPAQLPAYSPFGKELYSNLVIIYPENDRGGQIVSGQIRANILKEDKITVESIKTSDVTPEILASKNVIMIGNSKNNKFIKEMEEFLPVKADGTKLYVKGKEYTKEVGAVFVYPNLYNSSNKMIFIMGNDENVLKFPDFKGYDLALVTGIKDPIPFQYREKAFGTFDEKWNIKELNEVDPKLLETGEKDKLVVGNIKEYGFPDWAKGKVIYQIFVRSFYDSNGDGIGDLNGITTKLDYLKSIGADILWLTPIFDSPSTHGYDIRDYFKVNKDFGTVEDFRNLVLEAKNRKIKIILDVAFNHASRYETHFADAYNNPASKYDRWFYFSNLKNTIYHDWYYKSNADSRDSTDSRMPAWNTQNPEVIDFHTSVLKFWTDPNQDGDGSDGAAGFRFDIAHGPSHDYWKIMRQNIKSYNPNLLMVGEAWVNLSEQVPFYDNEMDTVFDFALQGSMTTSIMKDMMQTIEDEQRMFPPKANFARFMSNHDLDRFPNYIEAARLKLYSTFIYTLNGLPVLYYGDEIGAKGEADGGRDEGRRRPMEWYKDKKGEGMTRWTALGSKVADGISVEEQNGTEGSLLEHYKKLARIRRAFSNIFAEGDVKFLNVTENDKPSRRAVAYTVEGKGKIALVILNFTKETTYKIEIPKQFEGKEYIEVLSGKGFKKIDSTTLEIPMGKTEAVIYVEK